MEKSAELATALALSRAPNVVRVTVPVSVYFNLDQMQKVQREILGRLGCMACTSGWDIRYDIEHMFEVNEKLEVRPGRLGP